MDYAFVSKRAVWYIMDEPSLTVVYLTYPNDEDMSDDLRRYDRNMTEKNYPYKEVKLDEIGH